MISSMTAFGRSQKESSGYSITVEIRTLNGRYLDIVLRLPKNCIEFEDPCRKMIAGRLRRGRIEVFAQIETTDIAHKVPPINLSAARFYWEQLQTLHRALPTSEPPTLQHLLRIPHLFESREVLNDRDILRDLLLGAVEDALGQIIEMRSREGESLLQDCLGRLRELRSALASIESRKDSVLLEYRNRLLERVQELLSGTEVDENRMLQEVACYAERSDINEEMVRLKSHIEQIEALLTGRESADGRRLDFLTQELHREVNTIGCKTGDIEIAQNVVGMKSEIGKLKEQVQNVE